MSQESPYSNRQVENLVNGITTDIKEHLNLHLDPIRADLNRMSSKVTLNERMIWLAMGAIPLCFSVLTWLILDYLSFKEQFPYAVKDAVYEALDDYQFEIINPIIER